VLLLHYAPQGKTVVPLSIRLSAQNNHVLVISGPNAGGKSVCLKTVALLQYMLQCGLLVPVAEQSRAGLFNQLMIDIGDEQSIQDELSTYSSHLRNMKAFVRQADSRTLILIDEMGTGTEPLIGGALAEAILRELVQRKVFGIVTTHYTNLKHFAEQTAGVVNGAMLYDRGAMRPLFQLSIGQAGSSFAIEIARQTGLPESIIRYATELVGEEHIDYDKQLQDIARDKRYWENKRQAIRQKEKALEERIAQYDEQMSGIKAKKKAMLEEARQEAADILQRSNATIERTIREIKEAKADKQRTKEARAKVEALKEEVGVPKRLKDFKDLKVLKNSVPAAPSSTVSIVRQRTLSFSRPLDLRGYRADEALEKLIAYMDDALMVGAGEVTILHGTGTGALKQLTRDYLNDLNRQRRKRQQVPLEFGDGDVNHGGAGLTIVYL
jgi:DNA mismatch repair protein MutS2